MKYKVELKLRNGTSRSMEADVIFFHTKGVDFRSLPFSDGNAWFASEQDEKLSSVTITVNQ